jgi:hypothetical protein
LESHRVYHCYYRDILDQIAELLKPQKDCVERQCRLGLSDSAEVNCPWLYEPLLFFFLIYEEKKK